MLKPAQRAQVFLKNGTKCFQNSIPYERSPCFYVTITGNFERFQFFKFKLNFWKTENLYQKTRVSFFS